MTHSCTTCGDEINPPERARLRTTCKPCGEHAARAERTSWCIAPLHKSNYVLITDRELLAGLNNKGGLVR